MSETDNSTEPHVSGEELRAALAPRDARRNPVLVTEHDDGELKQLKAALEAADELRASLEAAREDAKELRLELTRARAESHERREALSKLANAGLFRRHKVIADLKQRNAF